ncbi:Lipoprotein-releasing system ATP-binding protein LolD [Candidatus Hepatincola sp. Pdp]
MNKASILEAKKLSKSYIQANKELLVFKDVSFSLQEGEIVALVGASGSGKTSLLNILGMLDTPCSGTLLLKQQDVSKITDEEKTKLRGQNIGFVFQFHNLLPDFNALENIIIPQIINGINKNTAIMNALNMLTSVGLKQKANSFPSNLSGGEQQRVALARALVMQPKLLIADEPTGNLDATTTKEVFALMLELVKKHKIAIILATHNLNLASSVHRIIEITNKKLVTHTKINSNIFT